MPAKTKDGMMVARRSTTSLQSAHQPCAVMWRCAMFPARLLPAFSMLVCLVVLAMGTGAPADKGAAAQILAPQGRPAVSSNSASPSSTFVVNTTLDPGDGICNSVQCTL